MRKFIVAVSMLSMISCGHRGEGSDKRPLVPGSPTKEIVDACLHQQYNKPASPGSPGRSIEIHSIKIGKTEKPDEQDKADGVPAESSVTQVKAAYTKRTFYKDATKAYRETGTFKLYKNAFGEWKAMLEGTEGTHYFDEPAKPIQ